MTEFQWLLFYDYKRKENPMWDEIELLIRTMDGDLNSVIILADTDKFGLADHTTINVFGGDTGFVGVRGELPQHGRFMLINPDIPDDVPTVEMHIQGGASDYDANELVPKEWAVAVVKHFYNTQTLSP